MALIPVYHQFAGNFNVNPSSTWQALSGSWVRLTELDSNTYIQPITVATQSTLGVLGDSRHSSASGSGYSADLIIGAYPLSPPVGRVRPTQNRASDMFDETLSSGMATVYFGGGDFWTDQFETLTGGSPIDYNPGDDLYLSANGIITNVGTTGTNPRVGILIEDPKAYPSGVPGTDTPDGSLSLGTFMHFVMNIQNPN